MKPEASRDPWTRLTSAARRVPSVRESSSALIHESEEAPPGFATRVTALVFGARQRSVSLLERFAFRALGAASLLAALSVAINYRAVLRAEGSPPVATEEIVLPVDDAIAAVLDFSN